MLQFFQISKEWQKWRKASELGAGNIQYLESGQDCGQPVWQCCKTRTCQYEYRLRRVAYTFNSLLMGVFDKSTFVMLFTVVLAPPNLVYQSKTRCKFCTIAGTSAISELQRIIWSPIEDRKASSIQSVIDFSTASPGLQEDRPCFCSVRNYFQI